MTRFGINVLVAVAAIAAPAHAQEAENPPAQQQPRPPVFDLQPGPVREEPQPNVQGPRAPGLPAPRLIEDEEEAPQPQFQVQPQPEPQTQPADRDTATVSPGAIAPADQPVASTAPAARSDTQAVQGESAEAPVRDAMPPSVAAPATDMPEDSAAPAIQLTEEAADGDGVPWWVWLGLVLAVGVAVAVVRVAARKRGEETPRLAPPPPPQPDPEPISEPAAQTPRPAPVMPKPLPTPPRAAPPPEPDAEDRPSRITVDFQPLKARLSSVGLTLSYRLDIQNVSDQELTDILVQLGIRCADGAQGQPQFSPEPPCVTLDRLPPGERHVHTGVIRLDPEGYRPVQSNGKPMIVPIVDMLPQYRDGEGDLHRMHAEMLVGREHLPPQPKMRPFWLERGFGQFEKIGCRMVSVNRA